MRTLLLFALLIPVTACALTPKEKEWVSGIQSEVKSERAAKVSAQERAERLGTELQAAKFIINEQKAAIALAKSTAARVEKERENWRQWGETQHDSWMTAEKVIAEKRTAILRRNILIGLLLLANTVTGYLLFRR